MSAAPGARERKGKGRCRYCGKRLTLTKDGMVRKHKVTAGASTLVPGQRVTCGGSGQVPT